MAFYNGNRLTHFIINPIFNLKISTVAGQLGGYIYYEGSPFCVNDASEGKWHVVENQTWVKDTTMSVACDNGRLHGR